MSTHSVSLVKLELLINGETYAFTGPALLRHVPREVIDLRTPQSAIQSPRQQGLSVETKPWGEPGEVESPMSQEDDFDQIGLGRLSLGKAPNDFEDKESVVMPDESQQVNGLAEFEESDEE